jgi:AAA+ superfamily predicted ATPase
MDGLDTPVNETLEADPKVLLADDVERTRDERDDMDRQIAADREKLAVIRTALDNMTAAVWRDVNGQQMHMRDRDNITAALILSWMGFYQIPAAAAYLLVAAGAIYALQANGVILAIAIYLVLGIIGYFVARDQSTLPIKKARASYLGEGGKDVRFVAFSRYEPALNHPLIGYDGPVGVVLEDRSWKIPGVRDAEAMEETLVEVIDERKSTVLLTRFPDRKPTLVHADLENPFIRSYGVFLQRALERQMPHVASQARDYREVVSHFGARKALDDRLRRMEEELREYDGTAAIIRQLALPTPIRNRLTRQVILYRLADPAVRRGCFIIGNDRVDLTEIMQGVARAAAATLLPLSFSEMKIGYVGQGASTVQRVFATAKRARSIIYISEAERLFTKTVTTAYEAMRQEVVQAIWHEWEQLDPDSSIWVIAAAATRDGLDESVLSRFGAVVDMTPIVVGSDAETITIDAATVQAAVRPPAGSDLSEPALKRTRMLAAMFQHASTMEAQGIAVPRAVLIAGPSPEARKRAVANLIEQAGIHIVPAVLDELDAALERARAETPALVSLELPPFGDAGTIARLAITIDRLNESKEPVFILAEAVDATVLDPELLARFPEVVDLTELAPEQRAEGLRTLLDGKPLGFDLDGALDDLLARTEGMTQEQLRHFIDEAGRRAALRAIDAGAPDHVIVEMEDFGAEALPERATKDDEAAL